MKKVIYILVVAITFFSCSSDSDNPVAVFDPNITINGNDFEITFAGIYSETLEDEQYTQFVLDYTEPCSGCPTVPEYQRIILNIKLDVSENIEGTYELSSVSPTPPMYGGYYVSSYPIDFYSGTVTVSKLGNSRYKLQFNTVKGRFFLDNSSETQIEGYFDGDFEEIDEPYWD